MRSAIRSLCRRPAFALASIFTVALGVGANTALFAVIYTVLIQPLPFRDPGKLVRIWETHPALPQLQVTAPDFRDWRNQTRSVDATLLIKTEADPIRFATAVRAAIQAFDSDIPISKIQSLAQSLADSLARRRFALLLLGIFGALAALLTAAGVYGLLAYSVNARVREFGVRGAVGATRGDLVAMILR